MSVQIEFKGNQEHKGVSLAVTGLLVLSLIFGYRLFYRLLPRFFGGMSADYILVSGIVALFFAVAVLWLTDPLIKYLLPSGSVVKLNDETDQLFYASRKIDERSIDFNRPVEQFHWSFRMRKFPRSGRERQIPGHWYCCACRLMQSDHEVVIFAFLHPRMYRKVEKMIDYVVLDLSELKDKERPSIPLGPKPPTNGPLIPPRLIVGDQGPYWLSERNRQDRGIELTARDYQKFLKYLLQY